MCTMGSNKIFVDTNLFLRYLTNDVPEQADAVEHILKKAQSEDISLTTNSLVMAEIVWTLESFYELSREEIQQKILAILNTPGLEVCDSSLVLQAILWYVEKNIDFIDAYNGAWMLAEGVKVAYTFDKKHFSRLEGVELSVPG